MKRVERFIRRFTADTLALIIFSLVTGIFGLLFERLVVGLSLTQMAGIRAAYNFLKYCFGGVCARIADLLRAKLMGNSKHPLRRALADGLALSAYQIPIYAFCALVAQARIGKVTEMAVYYFLNNLLLGWVYGFILDRVRFWLSVRPAEPQ